jgi:hypothetical protein
MAEVLWLAFSIGTEIGLQGLAQQEADQLWNWLSQGGEVLRSLACCMVFDGGITRLW